MGFAPGVLNMILYYDKFLLSHRHWPRFARYVYSWTLKETTTNMQINLLASLSEQLWDDESYQTLTGFSQCTRSSTWSAKTENIKNSISLMCLINEELYYSRHPLWWVLARSTHHPRTSDTEWDVLDPVPTYTPLGSTLWEMARVILHIIMACHHISSTDCNFPVLSHCVKTGTSEWRELKDGVFYCSCQSATIP